MRGSRRLGISTISLVLTALSACGGGGGGGGGVTPPPPTPVFTSLTVTPSAATVAVGGTQSLTASALDQNNQPITGVTVTYQSSDATVATVSGNGVVTGVKVGLATITATGTKDATTKSANASVTVAAPGATADVTAGTDQRFNPQSVTISPGGSVRWTIQALAHNVTFDGSAGSPTDIGTTSNTTVSRTFPQAGTYNYQCTIHSGMNGTVTVR